MSQLIWCRSVREIIIFWRISFTCSSSLSSCLIRYLDRSIESWSWRTSLWTDDVFNSMSKETDNIQFPFSSKSMIFAWKSIISRVGASSYPSPFIFYFHSVISTLRLSWYLSCLDKKTIMIWHIFSGKYRSFIWLWVRVSLSKNSVFSSCLERAIFHLRDLSLWDTFVLLSFKMMIRRRDNILSLDVLFSISIILTSKEYYSCKYR